MSIDWLTPRLRLGVRLKAPALSRLRFIFCFGDFLLVIKDELSNA